MHRKFLSYIIISLTATSLFSCQFNAPQKNTGRPQRNITPNEYSQTLNDSTTWAKWFQENREFYMYTAEIIEPGCEDEQHQAVNDLLSLLYKGTDAEKSSWNMIQWRLNVFYKTKYTPNNLEQEYAATLSQIDSLLNFNTNIASHERRKKSDLALFMKHFLINSYYSKLLEKHENPETRALIVAEQTAWNEYYKATADAFYKIILGEDYYYLKPVFWNNYKNAITEARIKAILSMYFNDISIWNFNDMCRWDEVGYEYDQIRKHIRENAENHSDQSVLSQLKAIDTDATKFKEYLNARFCLAQKINLYDENCVYHEKATILERYSNGYNH